MRLRSIITVAVFGLVSFSAEAADRVLTIINDSGTVIKSVAFSPPGTNRWFTMSGGAIDAGKGGQSRIAMPASACAFDFRVRFKGRPVQDIKAWNVCRGQALHVGTGTPLGD